MAEKTTHKLVIVESPAKAKTIAGYLGEGYEVLASFGHVRDLPERATDLPEALRKMKWGKLGVNVEGNFEPVYVVPEEKKRHVETLRKAAKDADAILLATDEDREGESISWHVLQLLKPGKNTAVSRIVFHEITPEAIRAAVENPRSIDENLVKAQETRRILDRLYGYTLSPVLWKKVAPKLSAGRVQSVAVRVLVERERQRRAFKTAEYWDLEATVAAGTETAFAARLQTVDGRRVATGKNFDSDTGALKDQDVLLLDEVAARALAEPALHAAPWRVAKLETRPESEKPPVPFMTSTLQQEGNRKLRFSSKRTMQIAQGLYEGVDVGGGERIGLITYMRTDSLTLSDRALEQAREVIAELYGKEYLPAEPARYRTKSKNAQEAHEAIRPTDLARRPEDVRKFLDPDQFKLYELIWKRTIACQMLPARVLRTSVQVEVAVPAPAGARTLRFSASGKQIAFPGFLRAYVEGSDDPEGDLGGQDTMLPPLTEGQTLEARAVTADGHRTKPPARYSEASIIKRLEEAGIGRPSTYASIISTVQDRGYVFKRGNELVPTFLGFAVTDLLEKHFPELVDLDFTARMEDELDEVASGNRDPVAHLGAFYRGDGGGQGLLQQVEERSPSIAYPAIPIGNDSDTGAPLVVRVGRYGTFVQRGEGGKENTVTLPEDTVPADLLVSEVMEMLLQKQQGGKAVGVDAVSGRDVLLRSGRFGAYLEVAQTEDEAATGDKPKRVSLPEGFDLKALTAEDVALLLAFPRNLGPNPDNQEEITVNLGRYGAYVRCGKETRNVPDWREAVTLPLGQAVEILRAPRVRRGKVAVVVKPPLREFGLLEGAVGPMRLLEGRYGNYVTDGETNATVPRGTDPQTLTPDEAMALIRERQAAGPRKPKRGRRGAAGGGAGAGAGAKAKPKAKGKGRAAGAGKDAAV